MLQHDEDSDNELLPEKSTRGKRFRKAYMRRAGANTIFITALALVIGLALALLVYFYASIPGLSFVSTFYNWSTNIMQLFSSDVSEGSIQMFTTMGFGVVGCAVGVAAGLGIFAAAHRCFPAPFQSLADQHRAYNPLGTAITVRPESADEEGFELHDSQKMGEGSSNRDSAVGDEEAGEGSDQEDNPVAIRDAVTNLCNQIYTILNNPQITLKHLDQVQPLYEQLRDINIENSFIKNGLIISFPITRCSMRKAYNCKD